MVLCRWIFRMEIPTPARTILILRRLSGSDFLGKRKRPVCTVCLYVFIREDPIHPSLKKQGLEILLQHLVAVLPEFHPENIQACDLVVTFRLRFLILRRWHLQIAIRVHVVMGCMGAHWHQLWSDVTCYCVGASLAADICTCDNIMETDRTGYCLRCAMCPKVSFVPLL